MAVYVEATDWDLIHRWEWFRRERWRQGFRAEIHGQGGGPARAFADLAQMVDAKVLLDASCGLGRRAIYLAEKGLNILGADLSGVAISKAREFARDENAVISFFRSAWHELPKNIPHHFNGILVTGLNLEPSWDHLGVALVGLYHALAPGGFLMFKGASEHDPEDALKKAIEKEWSDSQPERIEWFHHEGKVACVQIRLRSKAIDYIDDRLLYASEENGEARLETTTLRRPGYWSWRHWKDVTRMAGFCHLETREYPGFGIDGGVLKINVAWKAASDKTDNYNEAERNEPYKL